MCMCVLGSGGRCECGCGGVRRGVCVGVGVWEEGCMCGCVGCGGVRGVMRGVCGVWEEGYVWVWG